MYEWYFMYKDIVPEKTRKHEVAFQGTPPPTPQYAAHRSAQRGFLRRLGPFRGALTTLNETTQSYGLLLSFSEHNKKKHRNDTINQ